MRPDLPTGEVTLVFTDIEGSTRLLERLGAAGYAVALAEHRRTVRAALRSHGGVEVDTQGDAFFLAFGSPDAAARAAMTMSDGLAGGPLQIRAGVHTGHPMLSDEGYIGLDVHLAARVAAAAHGGQILLTAATRERLGDGLAILALGEHRLKDVAQPVVLFQLGTEAFPPPRTISTTNLPRPTSSFIGRQDELETVIAALRSGARLLTLTGPGGTGKTRLAIEAATAVLSDYEAGVYWVPLAAVRDPALVMPTIEGTIGAKGSLADHIGTRGLLLVLDNFEQVVDAAAEVASILPRCPRLTVLVTSREVLRIQGEIEYQVPTLARSEAIDLFEQRSGVVARPTVADLCARLDDLPLAIELVASRARILSPEQILERLGGRLDLPGGRDADPRQRTLRTTIEWSVELLDPAELDLFRRLAVFAGGATLESAEAIADADLNVLQSLVEKSLVRHLGRRFRMLATIREYAAELLAMSPDAATLNDRHARWLADLVDAAEPHLEASDQDAWFDRLADEHDDLRAALSWAIDHGDGDLALRLAGPCASFWWVRGHWTEGRRWLEGALTVPGGPVDGRRARALEGLANLEVRLGDYAAAAPRAAESLAISERLGDGRGVARASRVEALIAWSAGEMDIAKSRLDASAAAARSAGDQWSLSMALNNLGYLALEEGRVEAAVAFVDEAVAIARQHGDLRSAAFFLENLGLARLGLGERGEARRAIAESLGAAHRLGFLEVVASDLVATAAIAMADRPEDAAFLVGGADHLIDETGGGLDTVETRLRDDAMDGVRDRVGVQAAASAVARGRAAELEVVVGVALERLADGSEASLRPDQSL